MLGVSEMRTPKRTHHGGHTSVSDPKYHPREGGSGGQRKVLHIKVGSLLDAGLAMQLLGLRSHLELIGCRMGLGLGDEKLQSSNRTIRGSRDLGEGSLQDLIEGSG